MIDVTREELVLLSDAPALFPTRRGKKVSIATLYRWSSCGCKSVRLETVQLGGSRYTSHEAVARFSQALTALRDGTTVEPVVAGGRRQADVGRKLDALGI
jgi:hypothetical protein